MKRIILFAEIMLFCTSIMSQKIVYNVDSQTEIIANINTGELINESDPVNKKIFIACNVCLDSMFFADQYVTRSYSIIPETIIKDPAGIKIEFAVNTPEGFMQVTILAKFQDWLNNTVVDHKRVPRWADILMIEIDKSGMPKMKPAGLVVSHYSVSDITLPHYN